MIGTLNISLGIALSSHGGVFYWAMVIGIISIVAGTTCCVTGVLGVMSYRDQRNHTKNGFHMGFSIMACCISVVAIYFDAGAVG